MPSQRELESYFSSRLADERVQRGTMLWLGAFFWILIAMFAATAGNSAPEPLSDLQIAVKWIICGIALCIAVFIGTVVRRVTDERFTAIVLNVTVAIAITAETILGTYSIAALASMYVGFILAAIFIAQFLAPGAILAQMTYMTFASFFGIYSHYGEPDAPDVLPRIVVLLPLLWVVMFAVYSLRRERTEALSDAEHFAFTDPLTGLANLRALRRNADRSLREARDESQLTGIVVIDLDGFRSTNLLYGHVKGDRLLKAIADQLAGVAGPGHTVARTGSDEFMIHIAELHEGDLPALEARFLAAAVKAIDDDPARQSGIDASAGSACGAGAALDELINQADTAMYAVKSEHERTIPSGRANGSGVLPAGLDGVMPEHVIPNPEPQHEDSSRRHSLRWSQRPIEVRYITASWVSGLTVVAIALTLPGAQVESWSAVAAILLAGLLYAAVRYTLPPATTGIEVFADSVPALLAISLLTYLTGGPSSPVWPLVLMQVVFAGWFLPTRWMILETIACSAVILFPLAYDEADRAAVDIVASTGGVMVCIALAGMLNANRRFLQRANAVATELASIDPRTGVNNRREFEQRLKDEVGNLRYGDSDALAVVMIDLGSLKNVSAEHGRLVADDLLTGVAGALGEVSRAEDCVARLGGDEFAIVLPGVSADTARELAHRFVRAAKASIGAKNLAKDPSVRPSAGFALYGMHGRTADELVTAADVALTAAKTSGRDGDRVSSFVVSL